MEWSDELVIFLSMFSVVGLVDCIGILFKIQPLMTFLTIIIPIQLVLIGIMVLVIHNMLCEKFEL